MPKVILYVSIVLCCSACRLAIKDLEADSPECIQEVVPRTDYLYAACVEQ